VDAARLIRGHRAGEISDSVEAAVRSGALHPGDRLPPVRVLADQLGVSPTTVASAYRGQFVLGIFQGFALVLFLRRVVRVIVCVLTVEFAAACGVYNDP